MDRNLEQELTKWIEQQQKYARLFSAQVIKSRDFKKERLKQLIAIEAKYSRRDLEDPALLTFLKVEKRQLEHEVSPRNLSFLVRKVMDAVRLFIYRRRHRNLVANGTSHFTGSMLQSHFRTDGNIIRELSSDRQVKTFDVSSTEGTRESIGGIPNRDIRYGTELSANEAEKTSASEQIPFRKKTGVRDNGDLSKKEQAPRKRMKISR